MLDIWHKIPETGKLLLDNKVVTEAVTFLRQENYYTKVDNKINNVVRC